mgnify:CR=1 FL=1
MYLIFEITEFDKSTYVQVQGEEHHEVFYFLQVEILRIELDFQDMISQLTIHFDSLNFPFFYLLQFVTIVKS